MNDFIKSTSVKSDLPDGKWCYQCLACGNQSRDLFNLRKHIVTHLLKTEGFAKKLDEEVSKRIIHGYNDIRTCMICKFVTTGYDKTRSHFVQKHLTQI